MGPPPLDREQSPEAAAPSEVRGAEGDDACGLRPAGDRGCRLWPWACGVQLGHSWEAERPWDLLPGGDRSCISLCLTWGPGHLPGYMGGWSQDGGIHEEGLPYLHWQEGNPRCSHTTALPGAIPTSFLRPPDQQPRG